MNNTSTKFEDWFRETHLQLEKCKLRYEEEFRKILLERVGFATYQNVVTKIPSGKPEYISLEELTRLVRESKLLWSEFENQAYSRESFTRRHQKDNESIEEYFNSLTELAKGCSYFDKEERLRDQLIFGLKDTNMKAFALQDLSHFSRSKDVVKRLEAKFNHPNPRQNLHHMPVVSSSNENFHRQFDEVGIEGSHNSCYMDAALMGLFLFGKTFNGCLGGLTYPTTIGSGSVNHSIHKQIKEVLVSQVITPLQKDKKLPQWSGGMVKLRSLMATLNPAFRQAQMDSEEFVTTLFLSILNSDQFYKIDGVGAGFVLQTFADMTTCTGKSSTVQMLLEFTLNMSQVQLDEVPKPGFILKLPVSNGKPIFGEVLPSLELSLGSILKDKRTNSKMLLSAVVCLENNHYTVFVRTDSEKYSPWMYIDSFLYPRYYKLPDLSNILERYGKGESPSIPLESDQTKICFLLRAAYMCIYVPQTFNI